MAYSVSDNVKFGTSDNDNAPVLITNAANEIIAYTDAYGYHEIRYRDEYVGGQWSQPQGVAAPDLVNVTVGGVATQMYSFDGGVTEEAKSNSFEIAHDIPIELVNDGTLKLEWHVHMRPSSNNAGNIKWFFDWSYSPSEAAPIPMDSLSCIKSITANQQYWHLLCGTELPVPLGGYQVGGIISFKLRRTPTDTDDTYANDILLIKTALHVPSTGWGSIDRYSR